MWYDWDLRMQREEEDDAPRTAREWPTESELRAELAHAREMLTTATGSRAAMWAEDVRLLTARIAKGGHRPEASALEAA